MDENIGMSEGIFECVWWSAALAEILAANHVTIGARDPNSD
jgi:hypothetical protein